MRCCLNPFPAGRLRIAVAWRRTWKQRGLERRIVVVFGVAVIDMRVANAMLEALGIGQQEENLRIWQRARQ